MGSERPGTHTLLLVEDNSTTREALASVLRRAGYRVVAVGDGREALDCFTAGDIPDLILLDMLLPVLDGWAFLDQLRERFPYQQVPVIVTTGTILSPEWALAHDCQGFLKKPIENATLLQMVRQCLGKSAP